MKEWSYEPFIPYHDLLVFYNAMNRYDDSYQYRLIAMAKREETGMKYRFLCIASPKAIDSTVSHIANIEIYKPVNGMPYATRLHKISVDEHFL
jgi:hypothetical protein